MKWLSRRSRAVRRRGAAVAELAVCLPTIMLLVFGAIECCNMIFLDHALHVSAYEGARVAVHKDATNSAVSSKSNYLLSVRRIQQATVQTEPENVAVVPRGQRITVSVSAPCNANSISPPWLYGQRTIHARCIMVKE